MVVLMRKLAVCFTTCDVLCTFFCRYFPLLSFLSFFFSKSGGITHVFSFLLDRIYVLCVCVYVGVLCLVWSDLSLSVCVCMRMCQRLYEMCTLLSLVSLPGPQSVFLSVLFHTLFNFTTLSPFYHLTPRILCLGSPFFGTEPPFPDMSNMHLYSVG